LLAECATGVLVVIAEEAPPTLYAPQIDDVPFPYAVGLLLTPGSTCVLKGKPAPAEAVPSAWPHALELLRLLEAPGALHLAYAGRAWHWQAGACG
uniref:beta-ketoacyl synthase chain length factor n=1 Tax=uncultured Pseudomonas sp. TaxID=114707 RepID=UPI002584636C